MFSYLVRRLLYMIPILLGVMVITFLLFYVMTNPRTMAMRILGQKASPQAIENWLHNRGYDKPVFWNSEKGANPFDSQFFHNIKSLATFDLGISDATGEPVLAMFERGAVPSLLITLPAFLIGLLCAILLSLFAVFVRDSRVDRWGTVLCVAGMSIPIMVYLIFGQWLLANVLGYFPAFGFNRGGFQVVKFIALPVCIMVLSALGADVRLYRAIFLEEIRAEYIRTAQAKGASAARILLVHVLKNGMLSLITLTVSSLPFLIMGTLVLESFFGIPGLGEMAQTAIIQSDFSVVRADVYIGSILFLFGLLLTDICYALVDPRIRLGDS